jgi:hypothetical protein
MTWLNFTLQRFIERKKKNERRMIKEIYEADFYGNTVKRRPGRTTLEQMEKLLEEGHIQSPNLYEEF